MIKKSIQNFCYFYKYPGIWLIFFSFFYVFGGTHISALGTEEKIPDSECIQPRAQVKRVYLATYPRSGNHWMRYLIEEATHIATSSVYCDADIGKSHLGKPFPWGGYCAKYGYTGKCRYPTCKDTVVVKTHFPSVPAREFDRLPFIKTIRIVRHPIDSLYSFFVFDKKVQFSAASQIPRELLQKRINTWRKFHMYWDEQPNVITIRYEDLLRDPFSILADILDEVGYQVGIEDINRAIAKYPPIGDPLKHAHRFDLEDLGLIHNELGELMAKFNYFINEIYYYTVRE